MTKPEKAKKNIDKFDNYEQCLMKKKNRNDIVDALDNGDYDAIEKILKSCKVPADQIDDLMQFAYECYQMRYHQW